LYFWHNTVVDIKYHWLLLCDVKEKFRLLLEINEMVGGALDDTNPNRELIKEGKITKVSARDGTHLERYLFLVLYLFCYMLY